MSFEFDKNNASHAHGTQYTLRMMSELRLRFDPEWQFIVLHVKVVLRGWWCLFICLSDWLDVNEKPYMGCPLFRGPGLAGTDTAVD